MIVLVCLIVLLPVAAKAADDAPVQAEVTQVFPNEDGEEIQQATEVSPASSQPGPIPYKSNEFDLAETVSDTVLYLGILFTIAAIAVLLFKRRMVSGGGFPDKLGSHIRVVDRKALSTKTTVHLLEVDGRRVMVSESPNGVSIIELGLAQQQSQGSEKVNSGKLS
jgi:hypothetical protein